MRKTILITTISISLMANTSKDIDTLQLLEILTKKINYKSSNTATKDTLKSDSKKAKKSDSLFALEKRKPILLGYIEIGNNKSILVNFRGKILKLKEKDTIAGFFVKKITKDKVEMITPYNEKISLTYLNILNNSKGGKK